MKKIEISNITKGKVIAKQGALADSFFTRLKGLLGKKGIDADEALCIQPCKSVHTFFMGFSIDVIFVDINGEACAIVKDMKPNKISKYVSKARYVIELSSGSIDRLGIELGDKIELKRKENL